MGIEGSGPSALGLRAIRAARLRRLIMAGPEDNIGAVPRVLASEPDSQCSGRPLRLLDNGLPNSDSQPRRFVSRSQGMIFQEYLPPTLFKGKTVFITGGGSGINLGIGRNFAALGAHLAICGRTQAKLDAA